MRPEIGDKVASATRVGVIVSMSDEDGVVDDPEDAVAVTIAWSDGTFSPMLIADMEFIVKQ